MKIPFAFLQLSLIVETVLAGCCYTVDQELSGENTLLYTIRPDSASNTKMMVSFETGWGSIINEQKGNYHY